MKYQGDFTTSNTVYIYFNTFSSDDPSASMTITGLATTDIEIFKDGGATTRDNEAGYTLLDTDGIDFAGITGVHGVSVDLSDNTDAGFYAAGSEYVVAVSAVTLDGATINFVAATFSIERTGGALALLKNGTYGLAALETLVDGVESAQATAQTDLDTLTGADGATLATSQGNYAPNKVVPDAAGVAPTAVEIQAEMEENGASLLDTIRDIVVNLPDSGALTTIGTDTARLTAVRAAVLTDWINGERLDLILDAILAMLDDARAEPGQGAPAVNPDAMTKIDYLYKWVRNKKDNDGSTTQFYADDGTTVDHKQTTSEAAGTVTKAEIVTGP